MLDQTFRRIAARALSVAVALLTLCPVADAGSRHAAMILDANTGAVLYDQDGDELRHPASLTKMMTLYMAFELIDMGRLSYRTPIKVTAEAAAAAPSKLELEPGETILLIDAIKALVTKSANDMAIAIAQHIGGSEANFAHLMTEKARQLGMRRTVFRNASGLPDDAQVTTARDMITLGLHLQDDFPKHYPLFGLRTFAYNGGSYRNHNTLLLSYRGTDGIKTGYTRASGFNLVANVRRDGRHLVGAIFGGDSAAARNARLRSLFDKAWSRASRQMTRKPQPSPIAVAQREEARKAKPQRIARAETAVPAPQRAVRPAHPSRAAEKPETPAAPPPQPVAAQAPATSAPAAGPSPAAAPLAPPPQPASTAVSPAAAAAAKALADVEAASAATPAPAIAATEVPVAAVDARPVVVASAGPSISVARVRRIMVAPHVSRPPVPVAEGPAQPASAPSQFAAAPRATSEADSPAASNSPERTAIANSAAPAAATPASEARASEARASEARASAAPASAAPAAAHETVLAKTSGPAPGRPPSTFANQMAALAANVTPAQRDRAGPPSESAGQQGASAASAEAPGRAPSTLGAQADAIAMLARGEPPPPQPAVVAPTYRLRGPPPRTEPAPTARAGAFQIQIGAFGTAAEAERQLSSVQGTAGRVLSGHQPLTIPVAKSNRTLYRARFASFDANSAAAACLELRRHQIDCFVMKAD